MIKNKYLILLIVTCLAITGCGNNEKKETLKEFNGHVVEMTSQILKVKDSADRCITFDNREVTFVGGTIMSDDSVCVSYRGELDNGTPAIIVEFIPKRYSTKIINDSSIAKDSI